MNDRVHLGVHVAGWPAFVVDALLRRYAGPYLQVMTPEQRREVEVFHRAVKAAAIHWQDGASVIGTAEAIAAETPSASRNDELSTTQAAGLLGVSERRVCQLAAGWADDGLARKVGRSWLVDADVIRIHRAHRRDAA